MLFQGSQYADSCDASRAATAKHNANPASEDQASDALDVPIPIGTHVVMSIHCAQL
jgi:hypothetical protein